MQKSTEPRMPFGRYKGAALTTIPTGYLAWVAREVRSGPPGLLDAVNVELARRAAAARCAAVPPPPSTPPADSAPLANEVRAAAMALLSDLLAAGVRVVARGQGAVHFYGRLSAALRARLARHYLDIDSLARLVRCDSQGRPRITLASTILAGLRWQGFRVEARPGFYLAIWPYPLPHLPLREECGGVWRELWFRCAVGLPDPDVREPSATSSRTALRTEQGEKPPVGKRPGQPDRANLEALREHCHERVARCRTRSAWDRWTGWDDALVTVLDGKPASLPALAALRDHCRAQASRFVGGEVGERWRKWFAAVEAELHAPRER
jgi:uncharacterized protein (DUF3820 family)